MVWIKICANTTLDDAQMAADLGADAVGFVFAPSKRRVTPELAGAITSRLHGAVERIGVFQQQDFEGIRRAVSIAGLTGVQMHGGLQVELIARLREEFGRSISITQTLHWTLNGEDGSSTAAQLGGRIDALRQQGLIDRLLIDSKVGDEVGGTGRSFDWTEGRALFQQANGLRMIVAGGLKPENVASAIQQLSPWGIDVASGVEREPGRKDPERLERFVAIARAADAVNAAS